MYYEEKIMYGALHYRTSPDGKWKLKTGIKAQAVNTLMSLSQNERLEVFGYFCTKCGSDNPVCQCWNDE